MSDDKKGPKTPEEALVAIRRAAEEGRIEFASDVRVKELEPWVERVLEATAAGVIMVSDLARLSDLVSCIREPNIAKPGRFLTIGYRTQEQVEIECERLSRVLGVIVGKDDLIVDIAERLKRKEEQKSD